MDPKVRSEAMETDLFDRRCVECEELLHAEDCQVRAYECSRCGGTFTENDVDDRRCPDCHIFAAKVSDESCPECESSDLEEGSWEPPPPPTAEEVAEDQARAAAHEEWMAAEEAAYDLQRDLARVLWADIGPTLQLPHVSRYLADNAQGVGITLGEADLLAERITGLTLPRGGDVDWDARRELQIARWGGPEGYAEAFRGMPSGHKRLPDLAEFMRDAFGSSRAGQGTMLTAEAWRAIAERLAERTERAGYVGDADGAHR